MEFTIKDELRFLVETSSNYTNTIMYDDFGNPNIMVRIGKETYDKEGYGHYENGLQEYVHGAFKLENGKEVNEIWVSKYMNTIGNGGVPISMHNTLPDVTHSFDEARQLSLKKGKGWHLMTNLEWTTIIDRCQTWGVFPDPNPTKISRGYDIVTKLYEDPVSKIKYPYAGMGTMYSAHNRSVEGIYDMVGTIWEFVDGFRITKYGRGGLQYHGENGVPMNLFSSNKYTTYNDLHFDICNNDDYLWYYDVDSDYCKRKTLKTLATCFDKFSAAGSTALTDKSYDTEEVTRTMMELGVSLVYWGTAQNGNFVIPGPAADFSKPLVAMRGGMYNSMLDYGSLFCDATIYDLSLTTKSTDKNPWNAYRTCYIDIS